MAVSCWSFCPPLASPKGEVCAVQRGAEGHDPATAGKKGMPEGKTWREAGPCPEVGRERSGMSAGKRLTFAGAASRP